MSIDEINWRDSNDIRKWKLSLGYDIDRGYYYVEPEDLDELLTAYMNLIIECQKRGIIYG